MKLVAINNVLRTGDSESFEVIFSDETGEVRKRIRASGCEIACGAPLNWRRKLLDAIREAERDIACKTFGDDWRKHVGKMWGAPQPWEDRMGEQAAKMRPDLFGESQ